MASEIGTRLLWQKSAEVGAPVVANADLESYYHYPEPITKTYVRLNCIASLTGKVSVDGRSAGLGTDIDKLVFRRLRRLADVILVGAGTVRADRYGGARSSQSLRAARLRRGQVEVPQIAVVSASADLDTDSRLFRDTLVAPLILTGTSAAPSKVARLRAAGAEVVIAGEEHIDIRQVLNALASRNLYRILCEGGPTLFSELFAADAVDEICLTLAPKAGGAHQIAIDSSALVNMCLEAVLTRSDTLLIRYRRAESTAPSLPLITN